MRNLSAAMLSTIASGRVRPFYLVSIEFTSGTSYLWTGIGNLTWNGHTWVGVGTLGGISAIQESNAVQADNITLTLNGVPSALISQVITECRQNYAVLVYFGFLDDSGVVVTDPEKCFDGRLDVPTIQDGAETCSINITAENLLVSLQRASNRRYTTPDQKLNVSVDVGFSYVPHIQTWVGLWGRAGSGSVPVKQTYGGLLAPYHIVKK
jgi:hypothetical protein